MKPETEDEAPAQRAAACPAASRRADGEGTRGTILDAAAKLATVDGLEGLSIGRLADHVGMSKSGLYAHFGSKEELQLATIDTAWELFCHEVIRPALGAGTGIDRLRALCEEFLSHLERDVFPGGCFFAAAAAELDSRHGPVRDRVAHFLEQWLGELETAAERARKTGELDEATDTAQLVFELDAMLLAANNFFLLTGDSETITRARRGIDRRLDGSDSGEQP